jgi:hypothetical protein
MKLKSSYVRHQWLMPVILATNEAEIRRITIRSQPWANSSQGPISKIPNTGLEEWLLELLPSRCEALSSDPQYSS